MQACGRVFSYSAAPTRQSRLFPLRITMMRQLLNVVYQAIQCPLRVDLGLHAQGKVVELLVVPDVGKHRLHRGHALAVQLSTPGAVNGPLHAHRELMR